MPGSRWLSSPVREIEFRSVDSRDSGNSYFWIFVEALATDVVASGREIIAVDIVRYGGSPTDADLHRRSGKARRGAALLAIGSAYANWFWWTPSPTTLFRSRV